LNKIGNIEFFGIKTIKEYEKKIKETEPVLTKKNYRN
jgi:hypothetical protein